MNEQNWNLQQEADQYIPQKLPFFKTPDAPGLIKPQAMMHEESPLSEVFVGEKVNDYEALLV